MFQSYFCKEILLNNQLFNMAKSEVIFFKTVRNWPGFALQTRWLIMVFSTLVAC